MKQIIALLFVLFLTACAAQQAPAPAAEPAPEAQPEPTPVPEPAPVAQPEPQPATEPVVEEKEELGSPGPTTATDPVVLKQGYFKKVIHKTDGLAQIIRSPLGKYTLNLRGFDTTPGPGLSVVLHSGDVKNGFTVAPLTSASGNYPYSLPDNFDASKYTRVAIYNKKYNVIYGEAELK